MASIRPLISDTIDSNIKKVQILHYLYEKLLHGPPLSKALIYGLSAGYGGLEHPVAITVVRYTDDESLNLACATLPYGVTLIGIVEFDQDEAQDVYYTLDQVDQAFILKVTTDEKIVCSTGLDFLSPVALEIISEQDFWNKHVTTFRVQGQLLLTSLLEVPNLKSSFALAKKRIMTQAAYCFGKNGIIILPPQGNLSNMTCDDGASAKIPVKVADLAKSFKSESKLMQHTPPAAVVDAKIMFDLTKCCTNQNPLTVVFEKSAACKYFEHYLDLDVLVVLPNDAPTNELYEHFNLALCNQLELGFHACINLQLVNSISADKPVVYHLWPGFAEHFASAFYPENTCLEKLKDIRVALHTLFFIRETRPYFRQSAALYQNLIGLVSPHSSLIPKFSETELVKGHYEYRHYMQEGFNDDGWGCAYRSLQSIVSWFRLQGFTASKVPTHKAIQECLVSLGDKPQSFIGSKQWIGSTEVSFVLEAILGISCRIMNLSSGGEMASRVNEIQSHFRIHGTPIMVGGGVLAHTIIGATCEPDSDTDVNFLVLDPHYTGKDELKTILGKGWVGWKDNNFWSKKDFYNLCMPLLPSSI